MRNLVSILLFALFFLACGEENDDTSTNESTRSVLETGAFAGANVLLLSIDTVRPDYIGAYGLEPSRTSALDEILSGGLLLENIVCSGAWTAPCMMSVAAGSPATDMAAAAFKPINEAGTGFLPADSTTLAETLRDEGYSTYLLSGSSIVGAMTGIDIGFDTTDEYRAGSPKEASELMVATLSEMTRPWFAQFHIMEPHFTYDPAEEYLGCLSDLPALPEWVNITDEYFLFQLNSAWPDLSDDEQGAFLAHFSCRYGGELEWTSEIFFSLMLNNMEEEGLLDNTLVVVISDHGEGFGERSTFSHHMSVYPEETRVIGGFWAKDIESDLWGGLLDLGDIAPMTLNAVGVEAPESFTGYPLGEMPTDRILTQYNCGGNLGEVLIDMYGAIDAITGRKVQLVDGLVELYDTVADPMATTDLATVEEVPANLLAAVEALHAEAGKGGWCVGGH